MANLTSLDICCWLWAGWALYWVVAAQFVLRRKWDESLRRLQHTVPTLFALIAIFHAGRVHQLNWGEFHNIDLVKILGVFMTAVGHSYSIWARRHLGKYWSGTVALKEGHRLVTTGPYAYVRHPIYTGLFTAVVGTVLAAATWSAICGFAVMLLAHYIKWKREERLMLQEFGQEYRDYMAKTKAIVPFIF
ncbi:MAG TPA: isoprenylcysteine carboxylmethyltransferase family protein [Patescibacteria group bacterium]|nr:isoprenylcysteine carboxylmethyltransferase family protein [Patescibacteria group bacterium]